MCQQLFSDWEKLNFLKIVISETFLFIGFVKFEMVLVLFVLGIVLLDCRLRLLEYFSKSFLKETASFLLLPASRTCSMPKQDLSVPYILPSRVEYYLSSQNCPPC